MRGDRVADVRWHRPIARGRGAACRMGAGARAGPPPRPARPGRAGRLFAQSIEEPVAPGTVLAVCEAAQFSLPFLSTITLR